LADVTMANGPIARRDSPVNWASKVWSGGSDRCQVGASALQSSIGYLPALTRAVTTPPGQSSRWCPCTSKTPNGSLRSERRTHARRCVWTAEGDVHGGTS